MSEGSLKMCDRSQRIADEYCREVALRPKQEPELVLAKARQNLNRMRPHCDGRLIAQWERALALPIDRLEALLLSPEGADLRRNSPFAGLLSESRRLNILQAIRRETARA
jgi:hypothetical protein